MDDGFGRLDEELSINWSLVRFGTLEHAYGARVEKCFWSLIWSMNGLNSEEMIVNEKMMYAFKYLNRIFDVFPNATLSTDGYELVAQYQTINEPANTNPSSLAKLHLRAVVWYNSSFPIILLSLLWMRAEPLSIIWERCFTRLNAINSS